MSKLIFIFIIVLVLLNNCSFNENSKLWKDEKNKLDSGKNVKKIFTEDKKIISEFNQELKLDLSTIKINENINNDQNNFGSQNYKGALNKIGSYKFSKLQETSQLNFKPMFLNSGLIFFDKKGSIIRYDNEQKILWKKNHYTKAEKKSNPKISFLLDNNNILVTDSIAKYYSVDLSTGKLNWSKNNTYPFNSNIKKYKDKMFVVDFKNVLRCYKIKNGEPCWNMETEDSFTISNVRYSLIIFKDNVIFSNSIGDITSVNIETGLITWQLPTQGRNILNESYNFKISRLVSDDTSLFFSNNKNEFYSVDLKTGLTNWKNKINSNLTPILIGNIILTISNEGYLYVVDKNKGNILRVTDLYEKYKDKKRKNIYPVGFVIGDKKIFLTNSDGKMFVADIESGNTIYIEKISGGLISEPFIFENNMYVVRNGSIVQYD